VQRNADVVWLEAWFPTAFLHPETRLQKTTFLHAEVLDIRARVRQLQKLVNWEGEGAVVDRWIENCSMHKEPSRLGLGRYLKRHWQRELERQRVLRQSKPAFANKWQPPGPELHEGNKLRCNEGPICYALNVISQWHKEYRFVVGFLEEMEATVAYSPLENWGHEGFDASKPLSIAPAPAAKRVSSNVLGSS
jgi:hypothetical protein